jgi:hypothetical protein
MSRTGITAVEVIAAAQRIEETGVRVTVQAIREALGTGSFTTIAQHLRQWRSEARKTALPSTPLPSEVATAANKAIAMLWRAAQQIGEREIEAIRQANQGSLLEAEAQAREALQEVARLEHQVIDNAQLMTVHIHQIKELRQGLNQRDAHLARETSRAEELSARLVDLKAELLEARAAIEYKTEECGRLQGELIARSSGTASIRGKNTNRSPLIASSLQGAQS